VGLAKVKEVGVKGRLVISGIVDVDVIVEVRLKKRRKSFRPGLLY
jgi:hypothetical protein